MAHTDIKNTALSIEQTVAIAKSIKNKTRAELIDRISAPNYYRLCRLGIITEGATIDHSQNRIAVWKFTNRASIYTSSQTEEYQIDELNTAQILVNMQDYI